MGRVTTGQTDIRASPVIETNVLPPELTAKVTNSDSGRIIDLNNRNKIALNCQRHGQSLLLRGAHHTRAENHARKVCERAGYTDSNWCGISIGKIESDANSSESIGSNIKSTNLSDIIDVCAKKIDSKIDKVSENSNDQSHLSPKSFSSPASLEIRGARKKTFKSRDIQLNKGKIKENSKKKEEIEGQNVPISDIFDKLEREKVNIDENKSREKPFDTLLNVKLSKKFVADEVKKIENLLENDSSKVFSERKLDEGTEEESENIGSPKKKVRENWLLKIQNDMKIKKINNNSEKKIKRKKKIAPEDVIENVDMKDNELKKLFENMKKREKPEEKLKKLVTPKKITPTRKRLGKTPAAHGRSVREMIMNLEKKKL